MIERTLSLLSQQIEELEDMRLTMVQMQNRILHTMSDLEKEMDESFQLSFLMSDLKRQIDEIDLDKIEENLNDIDEKIDTLSYHYKRAFDAQDKSVYKVQNPFSNNFFYKKP